MLHFASTKEHSSFFASGEPETITTASSTLTHPSSVMSKRSSAFGPALSALGRLLALVLAAVPAAANAKELSFRGPSGYLYSECEGHCDYHWQCADALQCIKRDGNQTPVPGCDGLGKAGVNYCADPSKPIVQPVDASDETRLVRPEDEDESGTEAEADSIKALLESADVQTGIVPDSVAVTYVGASKDLQPLLLGNCQGHCNSDDHCRPGLRCLNLPGQTYIPGCEGQLEDTGVAVCYDRAAAGVDFDNIPEDSETLLFVGKRNDGKNYDKQLGKCMGDCRVDNDCRGEYSCLICYIVAVTAIIKVYVANYAPSRGVFHGQITHFYVEIPSRTCESVPFLFALRRYLHLLTS